LLLDRLAQFDPAAFGDRHSGLYGIGEATVQWGDEGMLAIWCRWKSDICSARIRAILKRLGTSLPERVLASRFFCVLGTWRR
jgi:hypothetical protein